MKVGDRYWEVISGWEVANIPKGAVKTFTPDAITNRVVTKVLKNVIHVGKDSWSWEYVMADDLGVTI